MSILHTPGADRALRAFCEGNDPVIAEMDARAEREDFPTVGHEVGRFLQWWVRITDARRVFECGSGFGYSAYWIADALPDNGEVVLTELDDNELADAREYLDAGGLDELARFECGDALEILAQTDEEYDLILLDHENERYREGFDLASEHLAPGGTVVADNVLHSWEFGPDEIAAGIDGEVPSDSNSSYEGIREYFQYLTVRSSFDTFLLPLGEGLLVSVHRPSA